MSVPYVQPLTPALSPEYRGEGERRCFSFCNPTTVKRFFCFCVLALCFGCASSAPSQPSTIAILADKADPGSPQISARLPDDVASKLKSKTGDVVDPANAGQYLRVARLDESASTEGPPIFGSYNLTGHHLTFRPEFRLGAGANTVRRSPSPANRRRRSTTPFPLRRPPSSRRPSRRFILLPTQLPANLLKFYVHFTRPMRQTDTIFDQLHIVDERGEPVNDPWRRFPQWSDDGKRLTLWIHPGRVKRGVNLREEIGPVLAPGKKYTLRIDGTLERPERPAAGKAVCQGVHCDSRGARAACRWRSGNSNRQPPAAETGLP